MRGKVGPREPSPLLTKHGFLPPRNSGLSWGDNPHGLKVARIDGIWLELCQGCDQFRHTVLIRWNARGNEMFQIELLSLGFHGFFPTAQTPLTGKMAETDQPAEKQRDQTE